MELRNRKPIERLLPHCMNDGWTGQYKYVVKGKNKVICEKCRATFYSDIGFNNKAIAEIKSEKDLRDLLLISEVMLQIAKEDGEQNNVQDEYEDYKFYYQLIIFIIYLII